MVSPSLVALVSVLLVSSLVHSGVLANEEIETQLLIAGGIEMKVGKFPFVAQLLISHNGTHSGKCGATIFSPSIALTAAHCATTNGERDLDMAYQILAGELTWNNIAGTNTSQIRTVSQIIVHEKYEDLAEGPSRYDLALLVLSYPLEITKYVQPARLPLQDQIFTGIAIALGWGKPGPYYGNLRAALTPIVNSTKCDESYKQFDNRITICAGGNGQAACSGDSGGPLYCQLGRHFYVCGVASFAKLAPYCEKYPQVFSRVAIVSNWILLHMNAFEGYCNDPMRFSCGNGNCIPAAEKCDRKNDCGTGLDELGCGGCNSTQFSCPHKNVTHCVESKLLCDGKLDCSGGVDEIGCGDCGTNQYRCRNGICIDRDNMCKSDHMLLCPREWSCGGKEVKEEKVKNASLNLTDQKIGSNGDTWSFAPLVFAVVGIFIFVSLFNSAMVAFLWHKECQGKHQGCEPTTSTDV